MSGHPSGNQNYRTRGQTAPSVKCERGKDADTRLGICDSLLGQVYNDFDVAFLRPVAFAHKSLPVLD